MRCGIAAIMLSRTESLAKIRACWNVRVRPSRYRRVGSGRRTAVPANRIAPASAGR